MKLYVGQKVMYHKMECRIVTKFPNGWLIIERCESTQRYRVYEDEVTSTDPD